MLCLMRALMISSHLWPHCSLKCNPEGSLASVVHYPDSRSIAYHGTMAVFTCHQVNIPISSTLTHRRQPESCATISIKVLLIHRCSSMSAEFDYQPPPSWQMATGDLLQVFYFWQLLTVFWLPLLKLCFSANIFVALECNKIFVALECNKNVFSTTARQLNW